MTIDQEISAYYAKEINWEALSVDAQKAILYSAISDASKDAWGFRTRFDYTQLTVEELEAELARWIQAVQDSIRQEEEYERYLEEEARQHDAAMDHYTTPITGNPAMALAFERAGV